MNARTFTVPLLAALLAVLMLASSAWAECAWVLWAATTERDGKSWDIIQAAANEQDCESVVEAKMKQKPSDVVGDHMMRFKLEDTAVLVHFICLPDTVDPRAPKASGR